MKTPATKICVACKTPKSLEQFGRDRTHSDGLRSSCEACRHHNLEARKWTNPPNCICEVDGRAFYLPPALKKRGGRFCSDVCKRIGMAKQEGTEKVCTTCRGAPQPLAAFAKQHGGRFGVTSDCKTCISNKWKAKYREEHPTAQPLINTGIDPTKGWGFVSIKSLEERFWEKVDKKTCLGETCGCHKDLGHCWPWIGHRNKQGYGQFSYGLGKRKTTGVRAHVKAWELVNGLMEPDQIGRHKCDNPPCARPDHVEPGTHKDNTADAISRGRLSSTSRNRGETNGRAKWSDDMVKLILSLKGTKPARLVAEDLGVPIGTILPIWSRHVRKHLDNP